MSSIQNLFKSIFYIIAQVAAWNIILSYGLVVLPAAYHKDVASHHNNLAVIIVCYLIHFVFVFLQQYCFWMAYLGDPGYVDTHWQFEKLTEDEFSIFKQNPDITEIDGKPLIGRNQDEENEIIAKYKATPIKNNHNREIDIENPLLL